MCVLAVLHVGSCLHCWLPTKNAAAERWTFENPFSQFHTPRPRSLHSVIQSLDNLRVEWLNALLGILSQSSSCSDCHPRHSQHCIASERQHLPAPPSSPPDAVPLRSAGHQPYAPGYASSSCVRPSSCGFLSRHLDLSSVITEGPSYEPVPTPSRVSKLQTADGGAAC